MNKYVLLAGFTGLVFSGCVSVTKELPAFSTYTLLIDSDQVNHIKKTGKSISISEPKAINSVNNILVSYADKQFRSESYALSKWSDKPTKILQQSMIDYLNKSNNYTYVHGNRLNLPSDIKVFSELDSFTQYLDSDKAYVEFAIRVFTIEEKRLETKSFTYKELCDNQSAKASVKALNIAVNRYLSDLNNWLIQR